jgi:hypothetical protein
MKPKEAFERALKEAREAFPDLTSDNLDKALAFRDHRIRELCPSAVIDDKPMPQDRNRAPAIEDHAPRQTQASKTPVELPTKSERIADDLLIGASAIAEYLGMSEEAVYHLRRTKRLPIGKLGGNLIASRRKLTRAIAALT